MGTYSWTPLPLFRSGLDPPFLEIMAGSATDPTESILRYSDRLYIAMNRRSILPHSCIVACSRENISFEPPLSFNVKVVLHNKSLKVMKDTVTPPPYYHVYVIYSLNYFAYITLSGIHKRLLYIFPFFVGIIWSII